MNQNALSLKSYALAVGTVVVLVAAAIGLSALFVHADTGPTVTASVTNSSNAVVTSAPIGSSVIAGATVASTSAQVPTGTVSFSSFDNLSCSGTPTVQSGVALVNGMASSSATAMTASGLSYVINYNGDANNTASVSSCKVVTPTSAVVTLANSLSATSVNAGSSITAQATLAGNTANAGGSVAYNVYTNSACTVATTSPASVTVISGIVPASAAIAFNQAGTYYWQSVYSGDANNTAATSSCGALTVVSTTVTPPPVVTGATGTISGTVYNDTNGNHVLDAGEAGIAGVTIQLSVLQNNWWLALVHMQKYAPVTTVVTDANGNYTFSNLAAGVYEVQEINQPGLHQDTADFKPIPLGTGAGVAGLNFANHSNASTTPPVIGKGHGKGDNDNDGDDNVGTSTPPTTNRGNDFNNKGIGHGLLQKVIPNIHASIKSHGNDN
jgi:hypothetical protein